MHESKIEGFISDCQIAWQAKRTHSSSPSLLTVVGSCICLLAVLTLLKARDNFALSCAAPFLAPASFVVSEQ